MRLGWAVTTDHFSSRAPDASRTSAASRGPFYFAWGCFRDFVSGLRGVPRRGAALRPGHEIVSASRSRRIDPTPMHHALGLRCRYHLFHQTFETADVSGRIDAVAEANDDNMLRWHDHDALAEKPECKERIAWNAHPRAPLGVFVFAAIGPETGAVVGVERSGG